MNNDLAHAVSFTRTLRFKVCAETYSWLNKAAIEVNQVWNWSNETSFNAARRTDAKRKWLSGFDLNNLSAGGAVCFDRIGADTIQRINAEYAAKRRAARKIKLRWRVSGGARRSLGWIPFKAASLKHKGNELRFCGKTFRVFERERLEDVNWKSGCFAQDSVGDWWLCLPIEVKTEQDVAPKEAVGVDLGLKTIATTSDGDTLEAGRWTQGAADKLAMAQRRGHKKQAKRIHRRIKRQRTDALHKFSRKLVDEYQYIAIGDVSSSKLVRTKMAKSVLDSGWAMFKTQLEYKGQQAARSVKVVDERYTTRACRGCGSLSGPTGRTGLVVRRWNCADCGEQHDRDVNAARNILRCAEVSASVCGNESLPSLIPSSRLNRLARHGTETAMVTA